MMKKYKRRYRALAAFRGNRVAGKVMASSGYLNGQIYRFKRKRATAVTVVMDGQTLKTNGAFVFKLSDVPNHTEFTGLFDKYRITGIRAQFIPRANVLNQFNLSLQLTEIPPLVTVVDYDDATVPTDYNELLQFENAKIHQQFRPFTLFFKPMVAIAAYQGTFTGYSSSRKAWIDAASPDVQYYGLKWATLEYAVSNNTTVDPTWDVVFTYYIQCKYPR